MNSEIYSQLIYNKISQPPNKPELRRIATSKYSVFLSQTAPSPSLEIVKKFTTRLLTRCHICEAQLLQSWVLMNKLTKAIDFSINPYSWQKLVTVSCQLLNKFFNDKYVWIKQISAVSGVNEAEMVKLEMLFSEIIQFDFYYNQEDYDRDWKVVECEVKQ